MHLVDTAHGLMGATGVVGGNIPLALGSALAARLRGSDAVAVVIFGDGAVQAGHFNESVNLATLWALPVILVCENNGFAEFTPRSAHTNVERVSDVVAPYGLERATVDGSDVGAVRDAFARLPRGGARRAAGRSCSSASRTACAATTRATRSSTARRSPRRSGRRATRSRASSARAPSAGWFVAGGDRARPRARRPRGGRGGRRVRAREPVRRTPG